MLHKGDELAALGGKRVCQRGDVKPCVNVSLGVGEYLIFNAHAVEHPCERRGVADLKPLAFAACGLKLLGGYLLNGSAAVDNSVVGGKL